jgi:SET domain-containing protein
MEYIGEVFSLETEFGHERMEKYNKSNVSYLMKSGASDVIDATEYGNLARFINHS